MPGCCVDGCPNRYNAAKNVKLYRLPSGPKPFQAKRRILWLQAIEEATGLDVKELQRDVRVCGAHFISGEASLVHSSPDFVPSVFTRARPEPRRSRKKRVKKKKMILHHRKRSHLCRTAKRETEETPPVVLESPVIKETTENELSEDSQIPSAPAVLKIEALTTEAEAPQTPPSPNKTLPSFKLPAGNPQLSEMRPVVPLKQVVLPAGGYQCEQCNQNFTEVSHFIKHKRQHDGEDDDDGDDDDDEDDDVEEEEEWSIPCEICGIYFTSQTLYMAHQRVHADEPSFPCNMCDRSFTTSHELKRHKLRHVRDGRKCRQCGVLFCQRHNHVLFVPQTKSEQDAFVEPEDLMPENETADLVVDAGSAIESTTANTGLKSYEAAPPAAASTILSEVPMPTMIKRKPQPSGNPSTSIRFKAPTPPDYPAVFTQPHLPLYPEVPSALQMFSSQCLTSALLKVTRNYEYIFSEEMEVKLNKKKVVRVKEERCEALLIPPNKHRPAKVRRERLAYDVEVVV